MTVARRTILHRLAAHAAFRQRVDGLQAQGGFPIRACMRTLRFVAAFVVVGLSVSACRQQETVAEDAAVEAGPVKGLNRDKAGQPAPDVELRDSGDEPATLADVKGGPVLVNIWATWCAPCVKELPTLQAVAGRAGAPRVIAVSQDMAPRGSIDAFLDQHKLADLEIWHDPKMALSSAAGAEVLPTTILYDADGREVWRYVGDLDWTGDEAARLLAVAEPLKTP
jgi:thiol-disulfide isomerase/thioredoxin